MTEAQFLFAIVAAASGDHTTKSGLCRQLGLAFPLLAFTPGDGDVILEARGVNGLDLQFSIVRNGPSASPSASDSVGQPKPSQPVDPV